MHGTTVKIISYCVWLVSLSTIRPHLST